ncbi:hypothetical protein L1887_21359 [Cichorium endivia]|nr:hypothetical protein L1887_21359 [Cichorium endivia]
MGGSIRFNGYIYVYIQNIVNSREPIGHPWIVFESPSFYYEFTTTGIKMRDSLQWRVNCESGDQESSLTLPNYC